MVTGLVIGLFVILLKWVLDAATDKKDDNKNDENDIPVNKNTLFPNWKEIKEWGRGVSDWIKALSTGWKLLLWSFVFFVALPIIILILDEY